MVSFPPVSPLRPCTPPSSHPYAPHAQPISFFSILSPAQYWVRSTNHLAPRYAISSIPPVPRQEFLVHLLKVFIRLSHRLQWHQFMKQAHGGPCCHLLLSAVSENTCSLKTWCVNSIRCTGLYGRSVWLSISHIPRFNLRLENGSSFKQWLRGSTQVENV